MKICVHISTANRGSNRSKTTNNYTAMNMTIGAFTTLLVVYVVSVVLCVLLYFRCVDLECKVDVAQESKDALRESMSNTNRYLQQTLERVKKEKREQRKKLTAEIHALRTQLHQIRKIKQKQDNG